MEGTAANEPDIIQTHELLHGGEKRVDADTWTAGLMLALLLSPMPFDCVGFDALTSKNETLSTENVSKAR